MELVRQRDLSAKEWVHKISRGIFCLAFLLTCAVWIALIFGYPPSENREPTLLTVSMSKMGQGPLALTRIQSKELQPLLEELILIGANTRPDQDRICSLALRSSAEKRQLSIGETLFFKMKEGRFIFSEQQTDLGITARSLESNLLICEIKHGSISEACTLSSSAVFSSTLDEKPCTEILKKGAVWGKDVFLSGWGGEEYREMTNKAKISLGSDVYFLKSGDCLWWNGEAWSTETHSDGAGPIAQLIKINSQGADFQVWDSMGFSSQVIHIGTQTPPRPSLKMDELITAIRPRSPTEITCQLGKRRVIVREGDWWLRLEDRWRLVRTTADLEACLNHQIPGELFIFEKIEASKGKVALKGRAFDRMRTSSEPVSLVMQTEKKQSTPGKPSTGSPVLAKQRSHRPHHPLDSLSSSKKDDL